MLLTDSNFVKLATTIDKVVVYLDGARVYRSGKTDLKKGFQVVKIEGLTKHLLEDSVRVSGKGKGSLGAIDIETVYTEEVSHEALQKLIKEKEALEKELDAFQEQLTFTQRQNERMKILSEEFAQEFPKWFAAGETDLTNLSSFIDFESKKNTEFLKTIQKTNDKIEELEKQLNTLQAKIDDFHNFTRQERTYTISISIDVTQAGPFSFEVNYQTKRVSWKPSYDIDLQKEKAIIKGQAQIINQTLEEWKDVSLEISTAVFKPLRVVEPTPFYIDIFDPYARPPPSPMAMAPKRAVKRAYSKEAKLKPAMPREAEAEESIDALLETAKVELKESAIGVQSFELSGRWSIPSDGNKHPVTLTTYELKTKKEFYWSSTDGLGVIAQDKITNGDAVILGGKAKVYSEGEFIGETILKKVAPREEFTLGAREEFKMKVEKKLLKRERVKSGLTKGKRAIMYEYEIIIKNFRKEPSKITIKDVIPYSRSERIKVKDFNAGIEPKKSNLGIITWKLTVQPDEEVKIPYKFEVEWEKDYEITPPLP